jgi:hypothetical protein
MPDHVFLKKGIKLKPFGQTQPPSYYTLLIWGTSTAPA